MSALEANKILASIIIAILVVVIITLVGDFLINLDNQFEENAYKIEIEENQTLSSNLMNEENFIEPI